MKSKGPTIEKSDGYQQLPEETNQGPLDVMHVISPHIADYTTCKWARFVRMHTGFSRKIVTHRLFSFFTGSERFTAPFLRFLPMFCPAFVEYFFPEQTKHGSHPSIRHTKNYLLTSTWAKAGFILSVAFPGRCSSDQRIATKRCTIREIVPNPYDSRIGLQKVPHSFKSMGLGPGNLANRRRHFACNLGLAVCCKI